MLIKKGLKISTSICMLFIFKFTRTRKFNLINQRNILLVVTVNKYFLFTIAKILIPK